MRRRLIVLALVALCGTTACGKPSAPDHGAFDDFAAYDRDYVAVTQALALPSTVTWPPHPVRQVAPSGGPAEVLFERGAGTYTAQMFWLCNWAKEYLRTAAGPGGTAADGELQKVTTMKLWDHGLDQDYRDRITHALDGSRNGDPAAWLVLFGTQPCTV